MNLVLLFADDFVDEHQVRLSGRRLQHLREVLQAQPQSSVRVGLVNGAMGHGRVIQLTEAQAHLEVSLDQPPPTALPLNLVLALPRPKMLKRIFQTCATMGVKHLHLINAYRVEKSYWQSPWLRPEQIEENLILGLEQAMDTAMPEVTLHKLFKPFVEDKLPAIAAGTRRLVAHPRTDQPCPGPLNEPVTLCIGPEGGFIAYEVEKLREAGFEAVHLGPRILRVETAVTALLARLFDATGLV